MSTRTGQAHFGNFGIAVNFEWALNNGAKEVAYIPNKGPIFEALKEMVSVSLPSDEALKKKYLGIEAEETFNSVKEMISNNLELPGMFTSPLFYLALDLLQWVETDRNIVEKEYRIRGPVAFGGMSTASKSVQIKLLTQFAHPSKYTLKFQPNDLAFFSCLEQEYDLVRRLIIGTVYESVSIKIHQ